MRELFDYWNLQCGSRLAPERADIEPGAIRRTLADTFILAFDPRTGHPFRIAGTRVCALFGRDLKSHAFLDLWADGSRDAMRELVAVVAEETVGVVASVSAAGAAFTLELLVLPLGRRGARDARVLGALAPSAPPPWPLSGGLRDLALGTHRYVGPAVCPASFAGDAVEAAVPPARIRHGFLVYDGGGSPDPGGTADD